MFANDMFQKLALVIALVAGIAIPGTAMAQSGRQLTITEDEYQRGDRYDRFNADTVEECARECYRDSSCRAFNYRVKDGRCDLIDVSTRPEPHREYVSGIKGRGHADGGHSDSHMQVSRDRRQDGRRYDRFSTGHVDECSHACYEDRDCAGFRYRPSNGHCVLMDRLSGSERDRDFVSGVKQPSERPHPAGDLDWDYRHNRACPSGYVNCDAHGDCERRGTARDCRDDRHRDMLWDYTADRPCPSGYVNCDASGGCGQRGEPRDCRRHGAHRPGDIYWDYSRNRQCAPGYVNCDASGDCGRRGNASACR